MLFKKIRTALARFKRDEEGTVAMETVILVPMLFWAFMTSFAIFHAYRQHSISQKAGYTIGDMISRETNPLDQAYMEGAQKLLQFLTLSDLADTALRISSVKYDKPADTYIKNWSQSIGLDKGPLSTSNVEALGDRLPVMKDDEHIIIVETWLDYDPPFDTGLARHDVVNFVFTRPRYTPQICWEECN